MYELKYNDYNKDASGTSDAIKEEEEALELIVYSGAGLKNPMEDIKTEFEEEHNVEIQYIYAGSAQLIGQMETSGKGDVFIVGSKATMKVAQEKEYVTEEPLPVAHHTPAIAVAKGNPKGIKSLQDLGKEGLRLVLGDPEANAIGKTAQKLIEKNQLKGIEENTIATTSTINEIIVALTTGDGDAGIVTLDSIHGSKDELDIIEIPAEENIDQIIPVASLNMSENKEMAQKLVDFISSARGKEIFNSYGFMPVK